MSPIYLLADTETTGVKTTDKVVEVAWKHIDEDMNVIDHGYSLINPLMSIPVEASAVHGILDRDVADAPTLDEYMAGDGRIFSQPGVVMIAHNAQFDFGFLKPYMDDEAKTLCTLKCARIMYPDAPNHKQGTLAYYLGLDIDRSKAHSADGDLQVLLDLLRTMAGKLDTGLPGLLELQNQRRKITTMPFGKHKGVKLSEVPKSYITWLLGNATNLDADLRAALEAI